MKLTLTQLRYALAAARTGNLSAAALELHVSQPSLTAAINGLEASFGQLFFVRRRAPGAVLTPYGRTFVDQARRILEETRQLENLARPSGEIAGEFVLGCFDELAPYCAAALMRRLQKQHPKLRVVVREEGFAPLRRLLADGSIYLALTYDLDSEPTTAMTVIKEVQPHALLAASHPLASKRTLSLAELAQFPLVLSDQAASWQHILELFGLHGLTPTVYAKTRSFEMQRSLVANGFGVALVYAEPFGQASYDGVALCRRPVKDPLPTQRIVLARDSRFPDTAANAALTEVAKQWFSEQRSQGAQALSDRASARTVPSTKRRRAPR
jgi:DNA-binding transcriptional LysR family regulator